MVELENTVVPGLSGSLSLWKRYVADTLCFVKRGYREHVQSYLNAFHTNIKFTDSIDLSIFRKDTNTDLYINWNAYAPETWKISTLKMLIRRAYKISTKDYLLEMELGHKRNTFHQGRI